MRHKRFSGGPHRTGPTSHPPSLRKDKAKRIYINLGRTGDAIASVPLCWLHWKETGEKCALMVAKEFSSFLEGISYIKPEIWQGDWQDIDGAKAKARALGYREIKIAQIYGRGIVVPHTESSFLKQSWKQVGRLQDWGAPLIFDRRNYVREAKLAEQLPKGKPIILVAADGYSAAFPDRGFLFKTLRNHFKDAAHVVDLADYRTPHFHDFLGLIDRAAVLVTCDTGFGQLACASRTPVCALIAYKPSLWHSSPPRPNHICYIRYNEFNERYKEMLTAISSTIGHNETKPTIYHVWTGNMLKEDGIRRIVVARETWDREAKAYGKWVEMRITDDMVTRSARDLGDPVPLPFIHDMLDIAAKDANDEDILMITNSDISLVPGLAEEISKKCSSVGAIYCHRWDFPVISSHIKREEITKAQWYVGCDLYAVTVGWWNKNRHELPPFVIGRECWDWVFRKLIDQKGGQQIEQGIYHEKHDSPWEANRSLAGNLHNRSYARAWLEHHKIDLAEITNEPFKSIVWPPQSA